MKKKRSKQPFHHVIIDDFLPKKAYQELKKLFSALDFERKEADLFSLEQSKDLSKHPPLEPIRKELLKLQQLLKEEFRMQVKKLDMHAMRYKKTDYLLCHDDRVEGRKIAYILYCSEHGKQDGGWLILREQKAPYKTKRLQPKHNRLVLFKVSPKSWHEVEEVVGKDRLSLGGWFH